MRFVMLARIVFVGLMLVAQALVATPWAAAQRFDEGRSFDRDYARRFEFLPPMAGLLTEAMFAQYVGAETRAEQLRREIAARRHASAYADAATTVRDEACGCAFDREGRLTDPTHCPAMYGVADEEKASVAAFMVIDPSRIARPLACFRLGSDRCVDEGGVTLGGVSCCKRADGDFSAALQDPHFWMLAPRPLVARLAGLIPGEVDKDALSICGFRIDPAHGTFAPPRRYDGMLARAFLYAMRNYGAPPPAPAEVLVKISETSAATPFEVLRERFIRMRYRAPDPTLDAALRAVPISRGFRQLGAQE